MITSESMKQLLIIIGWIEMPLLDFQLISSIVIRKDLNIICLLTNVNDDVSEHMNDRVNAY